MGVVSGTRGFSQNHYVAKEILELPVISPHLLGAGITSVYQHTWFIWGWGSKPGIVCVRQTLYQLLSSTPYSFILRFLTHV